MDIVKVLENIDKIGKEGIPFNVSLERNTLQTSGAYILGGFALCGILAGVVVGIAIYFVSKNK